MGEYTSISLSGPPGSGKTQLAKELSRITGWGLLSPGALWREMHKDCGSSLSFEDWWRGTGLRENLDMELRVRSHLATGHAIAEVRYAAMVCEGLDSCLRLYLDAPLSTRARRSVGNPKYPGMNAEDISALFVRREDDEYVKGQELYGPSYDHRIKEGYGLVIDSQDLSIDHEVGLVLRLLEGSPHNP